MNWNQLLCQDRIRPAKSVSERDLRTEFEKDYHRIVGSYKSIYNKNPILDYRIRHPKCKFCKYYRLF